MANESDPGEQTVASISDPMVICHWFSTAQGRWRDDVVKNSECVNQLLGRPIGLAPGRPADA